MFLCVVSLCIGVALGYVLHTVNPLDYRGGVLYQSSKQFSLIDPLLACEIGSESSFPEFAPLKVTLAAAITAQKSAGNAENVSVYMRTLKSGRWVEIDGDRPYAPASLLKVFIMMAYYKEADETDNPGLLDKMIRFEGSPNPGQDDNPGQIIPHLKTGTYYSVRDTLRQMIVYSDNDALNTLADNFDTGTLTYFELIFKDLNIPSPVTQREQDLDFMPARSYAMVFRVLFGSTYLSERYSEQALTLLSEAQYKEGIVAGVPEGIRVAHKFGVKSITATSTALNGYNELHDCGIVYYPNHPYLLCVMTSGKSFQGLQATVKTVSSVAYQWIDEYFKKNPTSPAQLGAPVRP